MYQDTIRTVELDLTMAVGPQITAALRRLIVHNSILPGQRLSEAEISQHFGVSRQPVREAFIKLAEEGLLEIRPQRGTFVQKVSLEAVLDARFVREAVEADIAKLCAAVPRPGLLRELRDQLDAQRASLAKGGDAFVPLDDLFHRTLAEAAGHPNAWMVIEGLKSQLDRVRHFATAQFPLEHLVEQHAAIVDAIEMRDPGAAEDAMRFHLKRILSDLPAIREKFGDYFELR
ncbi:DNA-binding GntR family transcriptional regulator [Breoghania corrubedonensis]|uniref:DNA-binding GntR family transcriptional regulator n=1 Tax=Breoghania corrubedonensis TaxID=665038 RepID=A0A2T5V5F8_9HYPH|nr:GntR family transcriptional regulator [Breoghania corrubedonensis]PTW58980.1 DNA-binding GntR family transcriptional regulator [Breoghania corrubedonensis]